jgi:ankyrin repeat protein
MIMCLCIGNHQVSPESENSKSSIPPRRLSACPCSIHAQVFLEFKDPEPLVISTQVCECLIALGADLGARDRWGKTALDVASREEHCRDAVAVLKAHGAPCSPAC